MPGFCFVAQLEFVFQTHDAQMSSKDPLTYGPYISIRWLGSTSFSCFISKLTLSPQKLWFYMENGGIFER